MRLIACLIEVSVHYGAAYRIFYQHRDAESYCFGGSVSSQAHVGTAGALLGWAGRAAVGEQPPAGPPRGLRHLPALPFAAIDPPTRSPAADDVPGQQCPQANDVPGQRCPQANDVLRPTLTRWEGGGGFNRFWVGVKGESKPLSPQPGTVCPPGAAANTPTGFPVLRSHRSQFPPGGRHPKAVGAHIIPKPLAGVPAGASPPSKDPKAQRPSPVDSGNRRRPEATAVPGAAGDVLSQGSGAGASASPSIET